MYQKEDKYSGAEHIFDKKKRIFYDYCFKANIELPIYQSVFTTMLQ